MFLALGSWPTRLGAVTSSDVLACGGEGDLVACGFSCGSVLVWRHVEHREGEQQVKPLWALVGWKDALSSIALVVYNNRLGKAAHMLVGGECAQLVRGEGGVPDGAALQWTCRATACPGT